MIATGYIGAKSEQKLAIRNSFTTRTAPKEQNRGKVVTSKMRPKPGGKWVQMEGWSGVRAIQSTGLTLRPSIS